MGDEKQERKAPASVAMVTYQQTCDWSTCFHHLPKLPSFAYKWADCIGEICRLGHRLKYDAFIRLVG